MRVVKGIVLLRTGAEMSQPSSTNRTSASADEMRHAAPDDELNIDHWTSAPPRSRDDSSPNSRAASDCEDWT